MEHFAYSLGRLGNSGYVSLVVDVNASARK